MIDPALLELLACPNCEDRPPLRLQNDLLVCDACRCGYPILDGIPHLLPEDAKPLAELEGGARGE